MVGGIQKHRAFLPPLLFLRLPRRLLCYSFFSIWFLCYRWMSIYQLVNALHLCLKYLTYSGLRSKRFRLVSEQRKTEERDLGFGRARNETRAKNWKWGEGEGKEGNACRQTPRFWKPAFASERSAWLARLVEQCWHVSIKGLFHTERTVWYVTRILIFSGCCLFWSARFALQCKSIFFDLFWNVRLFLLLDEGFR